MKKLPTLSNLPQITIQTGDFFSFFSLLSFSPSISLEVLTIKGRETTDDEKILEKPVETKFHSVQLGREAWEANNSTPKEQKKNNKQTPASLFLLLSIDNVVFNFPPSPPPPALP